MNLISKTRGEIRKVFLIRGSSTCHPKITFLNSNLAWFPPNARSVLQIMHIEVIVALKAHYRRYQTQYLIANMREVYSLLDVVKRVVLTLKK